MKKFYYRLSFSPYINTIRAKNRKEAWQKIKKIWLEYNAEKVVTLF